MDETESLELTEVTRFLQNGQDQESQDSSDTADSASVVEGAREADGQGGEKSGPMQATTARRKRFLMIFLVLNNFFLFMGISCPVSFLPGVASSKAPNGGAGVYTAIGFIFSITTVVEFIVSPFIGRDLPQVGTKLPIVLGLILVSGCAVLISFMAQIQNWPTFLGLSYAIRAVQGVGTGAVFTSSFALIANTFPDDVASKFGILECSSSLGFIIGPLAGGLLFDRAGFQVTFLTFGGVVMVGALIMIVFLPSTPTGPPDKKLGLLTLLRVPWVVVQLATIFLANAAVGYFDSNLSPFVKAHFHLSATLAAVIYVVPFAAYTLVAPNAGRLSKAVGPRVLIPTALYLAGVGFVLLGPTSVLGLQPALWRTCAALVLIGMGAAIGIVLPPADILGTMRSRGHQDSLELHGAIGGLAGAATSLGVGAGPTVGGFFSGLLGFQESGAVFGLAMFAQATLLVIIACYTWSTQRHGPQSASRKPGRRSLRRVMAASQDDAAKKRAGFVHRLGRVVGGAVVRTRNPHGALVWYPDSSPNGYNK